MAITESRPAQPSGEPPTADGPVSRRHHRWRRWILLVLGALFAAAVVVLAVLAGTYQPVGFGYSYGAWNGSSAGLPAGTGLRSVNTFGGATGEIYVPPQSGVFTVLPTIFNTGPQAVTIEAVTILSPQEQADAAAGEAPWPVVPAGPVQWGFQYHLPGQTGPTSGRSAVGVSLPPGQGMALGIPLRMAGACYDPNGWTGIDTIYVKVRFLAFTHWVAVKFEPSLIMHEPSPPSGPGAEPAADIICPPGTRT